jgi:hypothetical protein
LRHGTHGLAIDRPNDLVGRPVDTVCMELIVVVGCAVVCSAVVASRGYAFSKVIALGLGVVSAQPLPIDLVEAIGLKNGSTDNSGSWRRFDHIIHVPKHDVPS